MGEWVLILTTIVAGHVGARVTHTPIPGFGTEAECMVAAKKWALPMRKNYRWVGTVAICVKRTGRSAGASRDG